MAPPRFLLVTSAVGFAAGATGQWSGLSAGIPGRDASVSGLAVVEGAQTSVWAGGHFASPASNLAVWNATHGWWDATGGVSGDTVGPLLAVEDVVYVGGYFSVPATNVALYNTSSGRWQALGSGVDNMVSALASMSGLLYVGGAFQHAGGQPAIALAVWDGEAWHTVGGGVAQSGGGPSVFALLANASTLYVGGSFDSAGGQAVGCVAAWNGSKWDALGGGISQSSPEGDAQVAALALSDAGWLYVGGSFNAAGGVPVHNLAAWDGSAWHAVGGGVTGLSTFVYSLISSQSVVFVGGVFSLARTVSVSSIAAWNGSAWDSLDSGVHASGGGTATVLDVYLDASGALYVSGVFATAGPSSIPAPNIAVWS
jgi:trimeric autotransporter adhesin